VANGLRRKRLRDQPSYAKTSCSSNCTLYSDQNHGLYPRPVAGRRQHAGSPRFHLRQRWPAHPRAEHPTGGQCTVRDYGFSGAPGADSNRTTMTTHVPGTGGACDPNSTGTTTSHQYDAADRLTDAGYTYDSFGRTLAVPASDAGSTGASGNLNSTYFASDRVASPHPGRDHQVYTLDPRCASEQRSRSGTSSGSRHEPLQRRQRQPIMDG